MEQFKIVRTLSELQDLKEYIKDKEFISFDCETTGTTKDSQIIGVSVSANPKIGYYVILSYWDVITKQMVDLETTQEIKSFIELLVGRSLIMHNGVFDSSMVLNNYGIDLMPYLHTDTMILAHLLDENRMVGLKELGVSLFGANAKDEQNAMKESVHKNGGQLTKDKYELYKADAELIARYGAMDAILTLKIFYILLDDLDKQDLYDFFYKDESMPLLRGPTYDMNTEGLRIDSIKLMELKKILEAECLEAKSFIYREIDKHIKDKYPGTSPKNTFNMSSTKQLAWLLFFKLDNVFNTLTEGGREVCKALNMKLPYTNAAKREFIRTIIENKDREYAPSAYNWKTKKMSRPKKIGDPWNYTACGKESLMKLSDKYKWVQKRLEYGKNLKILNTYVEGIERLMTYNIIRPSFLQHGTTSGRYSSRRPNFQNLPRDDKRVKECIVAREGKIFVGADYSQLEPRVFASLSKDEKLLASFKNGHDFYSVIGMEVFDKYDCSLKKDDIDSFAKKYPDLRNIAKVVALSSTYGTTAPKMAPTIKKEIHEAQEIIDNYFEKFPNVYKLMIESHEMAKKDGVVKNLFGRPRRIPKAMEIPQIYGKNTNHANLPYEARNILNLAINHRIQSTGASIMNRAAISCWKSCQSMADIDPRWAQVKLVLQVHDELILEGPEELAEEMIVVLKYTMENTVKLPGVDLITDPKIGKTLAELK